MRLQIFIQGMVVFIKTSSIAQIDLLKNYSYSIGPCVMKKKILLRDNYIKIVNRNVQRKRFPNLLI